MKKIIIISPVYNDLILYKIYDVIEHKRVFTSYGLYEKLFIIDETGDKKSFYPADENLIFKDATMVNRNEIIDNILM